MDNYRFIREVRNKKTDVAVSINNFITKYERLTGITFVCREVLISIEDFLRTLEFIVPEHIIKHHKSFVTLDEIMVYRLEITDRYKKPLKPEVIKSIEKSLKKLIVSSYSKSFAQLKSIGGFEHFARAIIPFLMEELKKTALTQVFINTDKKTLFSIEIRLIIVSNIKGKYKEKYFISKLLNFPGFDITSFVPARKYSMGIEVSLLQIKVDLSEFATLNEIYSTLRGMLEKFYGIIHDFDKGFREIDLIKLNELSKNMPDVPQSLIREIYFSFDALYRIETPGELLQTIIELCGQTVKESEEKSPNEILFKSYNNFERDRIILVISCMGKRRKKILNRMVRQLQDIDINFSKIEWNQRSYLLLILGSKGKTLNRNVMKDISNFIDNLIH